MNTILTLCYQCSETYKAAPGVKITEAPLATTEKKKYCEHCRRRGSFSSFHVRSGRK